MMRAEDGKLHSQLEWPNMCEGCVAIVNYEAISTV